MNLASIQPGRRRWTSRPGWRDLGLEDYAEAFRANHIDAEVLRRLTADDLIALGITSVGHRRKILRAIAALDQRRAPSAAEPLAAEVRAREADRRQFDRAVL
jgi:hypothetical protein